MVEIFLILIIIVILLFIISILAPLLFDQYFYGYGSLGHFRIAFDMVAVAIPPQYTLKEVYSYSFGDNWFSTMIKSEPRVLWQAVFKFHEDIVIKRDQYYNKENNRNKKWEDWIRDNNLTLITTGLDKIREHLLKIAPLPNCIEKNRKNENCYLIDQYFKGNFHCIF